MLPTLTWKEEFSIGIDAIDDQHRMILEKLLALENAVEKRDPWHILQYFLAEIMNTLKFHLAVEEALLEILAYPQLVEHRSQHAELATAMADLENELKRSPSATALLGFLEQWFLRHVLCNDRQYVSYVKSRLASF